MSPLNHGKYYDKQDMAESAVEVRGSEKRAVFVGIRANGGGKD